AVVQAISQTGIHADIWLVLPDTFRSIQVDRLNLGSDDGPPAPILPLDGDGLFLATDLAMIVQLETSKLGQVQAAILDMGSRAVLGISKTLVALQVDRLGRRHM